MHDADAGRHHLERVKRLHPPFQKLVALAVARELQIQIPRHRIRAAREIHLHGMVHHQIHRHERLDDFGILAKLRHRTAHRGQIHEQRHAGEILHFYARIYLVGSTLYQTLIASPLGTPYPSATTFLNSFQLIPRVSGAGSGVATP